MEASLIMYGGRPTYTVNTYRVRIYHVLSAVDNTIIIIKLQTSCTSNCWTRI